METIRSRQNAQVKALRLAASNNGRVSENVFVAEGWHLLDEAARHQLPLQQVFVREDALLRWQGFAERYALTGAPVALLSAVAFDSAMETASPQGIAAFVQQREHDLDAVLYGAAPLAVVVCGVQDPGNVGTILRSALAFGADAAFVLPGSANPFGMKALRASAGAAFALPVFVTEWKHAAARLAAHGCRIAATVPRDGVAAAEVDWRQAIALLLGSEGAGLDAAMIDQADVRVTIPMPGGAESLNVATAAGILLYEASKARSSR